MTSSDLLHLPLSYYKELLISRLISLHQHSEALCIDHLWLKVGCNWLEHLRTSAGKLWINYRLRNGLWSLLKWVTHVNHVVQQFQTHLGNETICHRHKNLKSIKISVTL